MVLCMYTTSSCSNMCTITLPGLLVVTSPTTASPIQSARRLSRLLHDLTGARPAPVTLLHQITALYQGRRKRDRFSSRCRSSHQNNFALQDFRGSPVDK